MNEKIKNAAIEIVEKLKLLPADSEFIMGDYFDDYDFDSKDKFALMKEVLTLCENENIEIINMQANMILGMPWVYIYKKV